jgi:uncharacterized membrane protein YqgA involved in biofilm formation
VNAAAIIGGTALGLLLKRGIPERYQVTIMQGLGMVIAVIGVQMALQGNMLILVGSLVFGSLLGEWLALDSLLDEAGRRLAGLVAGFAQGTAGDSLRDGFVTATLVYCVGAMSIVGSIEDGLTGNASILLVKSLLDGTTAIFFASSMGVGVAFSAVSVLLYQGAITLAASFLSGFLSDVVIKEMSAAGGVMILGIALVMLKISAIRLANLLPALPCAVVFTLLYTKIFN